MCAALRKVLFGVGCCLCGVGVLFAEDPPIPDIDWAVPFVIGGSDAPLGKYPWMVALVGRSAMHGDLNERQFCSGVLVHPYWVLTAAHCVSDLQSYENLAVAVGNGNLVNGSMNEYVVDLVIRHHAYSPEIDLDADVALLRLKEPVLDREPIAINLDDDFHEKRASGRVLGWGKTNQDFNAPDDVQRLQEASLPIVDRAVANSSVHFDGDMLEAMFAAGNASPLRSGYVGDSGGPFVMENVGPEDYVLLGITSWGDTCNLNTTPYTVFGSVSKYQDWITSVISPENFQWNESLRFAKYLEVDSLEDKVDLQSLSRDGVLGFSLEQSMSGRSDLSLQEVEVEDSFGYKRLKFSEVGGFSALQAGWRYDPERGVLERRFEPSISQSDNFLLKVEQTAGISPRPGPYPLGPGMLASGKRLAESNLFGDRSLWFELIGHQAGDLLTFSGWSPNYIGMAIVESDGERTTLVAKNFSRDGEYPWGVHSLDARTKEGMRYYGIVQESRSFEVSTWVNLDRREIRLNIPISGTLDASDMRTPREGHFCEFFEMYDKSNQTLRVDLYSDFDGVLQLIELESGKVLSEVDDVNGSGTESLYFYHRDADKSLGIRFTNTNIGEMGNYRIEFKSYNQPRGLRIGTTARSAIMEDAESEYFEGETLYFDFWELEGLSTGVRTYLGVRGLGMYVPAFAILDVTSRETVFEGYSVCPDDAVASFVPAAGRNYVLAIAGVSSDLNGNYEILSSRNPIVFASRSEGEPAKRRRVPMNHRSVFWSADLMQSH